MIDFPPTTRPRALLIAEAANPEWTSVPLVGWSLSRALMDVVDAHIVTHHRNRQALLRAGLVEGIEFTAIDSDFVAKPLDQLGWRLRGGRKATGKGWTTLQALNSLANYYFEHLVWRQFKRRIESKTFDVVHRITPLSPTVPSLLAKKCHRNSVPFVIGPLNGGVPWPKWFRQERQEELEWLAPLRSAYKLLPGYRSTRKYSSAIIVGSRDTQAQMPPSCRARLHYLPENAIDPARFSRARIRSSQLPLQLLFVGRLVPYKGVDMLIEAADPLLASGRAELTIVGDGPRRAQLEHQAANSARPAAIRFVGAVPHERVQDYFVEADLFVFPSIREFGGGVVLEAMAMGAVPLIVNYGGPAELVPEAAGLLVPIGPRGQIVAALRSTLEAVAADPSALNRMSVAGRAHVGSNFTWQAKAAQVTEVDRQVIRGRSHSRIQKPSTPQFADLIQPATCTKSAEIV